MNIIILFIISSVISIKPKICINCKFCIPEEFTQFSKCSLYPLYTNYELVNGIENKEYKYCSTARMYDYMCGIEGKMYKKKREIKKKEDIKDAEYTMIDNKYLL